MESTSYLGHSIEFEPTTHGLPFGVFEYWFNISDDEGPAFRVAMRIHRILSGVVVGSDDLALEMGLSFTKGRIALGYEHGRVYQEDRTSGWSEDWNAASFGSEDLQVELLRALRRVKRIEDRLPTYQGLDVAGIASVLGVRLGSLQDALSDLLTKGLATGNAVTTDQSPIGGACTISSVGLAVLERVESARKTRETLAVMFTDLADSTTNAARLGDESWDAVVREHASGVAGVVDQKGGRVWKPLGDGFLITFPTASEATDAAPELVQGAANLGVVLRIGIHTGEVDVGESDVTGLVVTIAARVCGEAAGGQILITRTTGNLAGLPSLEGRLVGTRQLKGVPGEWELYELPQ